MNPHFAAVGLECPPASEWRTKTKKTSRYPPDMLATLVYEEDPDGTVAAIRATLDFAGVQYVTAQHKGAMYLALDDDLLTGWLPIFYYASREAHTLPSHPLHSAWVHEAIQRLENTPLKDLEVHGTWLVPDLAESTAADFLAIYRLRHARSNGLTLPPPLAEYADQDPTMATETYTSTKEPAGEMCVVS